MWTKNKSVRTLAGFAALTAGIWSAAAVAQPNSVYTDAQVAAGRDAYNQNCAACHMANLSGEGEALPLAGADFMGSWGKRSSHDLFNEIKIAMPVGRPNSLGDDTYTAITAYILQANGAHSGTVAFTPDTGVAISTIATGTVPADIANAKRPIAVAEAAPGGTGGRGGPGGAGAAGGRGGPGGAGAAGGRGGAAGGRGGAGGGRGGAPAAPLAGITVAGTVKNYTPITEAMMANPSASDWLMHLHNYAGWSFSPLSQINTKNVGKLALKWVWPMDEGGYQQMTPLVHDGVMFISNNLTNKVQALNAKTGDLIWENIVGGVSVGSTNGTRTSALYGDRLFYPATDGKLYALDAKTGKVDWVINPIVGTGGVIGGIMTAHDKVFVGSHGCGAGAIAEQCFLAAFDVNTGKEIWRFLTTAGTGTPGGDTWDGLPDSQRTGNSIWTAPTYDSKLNLIYFGTGQNKTRGVKGDALYALSTVALDADTGKLKWYFQSASDYGLDLDEAFEKTLVDEGDQKVLLTTGKKGIMWKLDRVTGKYLGNRETVYQNVFTGIDPKTGRGTYRADIQAQTPGAQIVSCPTSEGGHNWQAASYTPAHDLIILPLSQSCSIGGALYEMPGTDGNMGRVSAYEVKTMKPVWTFQQRAPFLTSVMTTGGDVGFVGDWDRTVRAFDVKTGKTLWQSRLGTTAQGYIITYSVDGQQYVAVPTGYNGGSPETKPNTMLGGSLHRPTTGQAVYVFALPKSQ